jgi:hypothetical protein
MGFPFARFFSILTAIAPVILMAVPGGAALAPLVPIIVQGVADAQQQPGATGATKKAYVMALVTDAVTGANTVKPGTIDAPTALTAASEGIDAVITSVNAVQLAHANQPTAPPTLLAAPPTSAPPAA